MNGWVILFWVASTLMACWGFSLFVRLVSETIARRRKRLEAKHSRRAGWMAMGLMIACLVVSVGCGYIAVDLAEQFSRSGDPVSGVNSATVIGWTMGLFGVFLVIWWVVGDRARGRVRCPRCWYDMNDAVGLLCPECGKTAKDEGVFLKARRPRWMALMALFLMGSGWYGMVVGPRVVETGEWFAAVPTWVLMAGWEVLPEEWIYYAPGSPVRVHSRLSERIDERWVSDARSRRFARRICKPMMTSKEARWDPKRLALLREYRGMMLHSGNVYTPETEFFDPPVDAERLLYLGASDLLDAAESLSLDPNFENPVTNPRLQSTPFVLSFFWLWLLENETLYRADPDGFSNKSWEDDLETYFARALEPLRDRASSPYFGQVLKRNNLPTSFPGSTYIIADYLNLFTEHIDALMSTEIDPVFIDPESRFNKLALMSEDHPVESLLPVFEICTQWLNSGDRADRSYAILAIRSFQNAHLLDDTTDSSAYQGIIELIKRVGLGDMSKVKVVDRGTASIHHLVLSILVNHDSSGETVYPLLSEFIRTTNAENPSTNRYAYYRAGREDRRDLGLWIEWFGWIVDSPSFNDRFWLAINLPNMTGTVHDDQLNELGRRLAIDENGAVAKMAAMKLEQRDAEHLIPSD